MDAVFFHKLAKPRFTVRTLPSLALCLFSLSNTATPGPHPKPPGKGTLDWPQRNQKAMRCPPSLTLKLVLRTPALQQREVTHDVLQLHRIQRLRRRGGRLQRGRVAFDQLQPCRETRGEERSKRPPHRL